jgi:molybdopterin converting factor small subunit
MPVVKIPPPYRGPTRGAGAIEVAGATVREALEAVDAGHPGFADLIFDGAGSVHKFVTLFVNGQEIAREAVDAPVAAGDEVDVIAAIAGG